MKHPIKFVMAMVVGLVMLTAPSSIAGDIRDIRGPYHIPDPLFWLYYAGGGCLLFVAVAAVWMWYCRRRKTREKQDFEIAFEQLEKARALMVPEEAGAFSEAVSSAIRTYIEKRFRIGITRHTTEEFMRRISVSSPDGLGEYSDLLHDFLAHCDLAKFACYTLSVDQMKAMHKSAWQFVERTRPRPEEERGDQRTKAVDQKRVVAAGKKFLPLSRRLWERGQRLIPTKTMGVVGLDNHSAIVAGGR